MKKDIIYLEEYKLSSYYDDNIEEKLQSFKIYPRTSNQHSMIPGQSSKSKIEIIRKYLKEINIDYLIITELDSIAYILNIRSDELQNEPLFFSFLVFSEKETLLFTNKQIEIDEVEVNSYSDFYDFVEDGLNLNHKNIFISGKCNEYIFQLLNKRNKVTFTPFIREIQSIKNNVEIAGMQLAQIYSAVAVTNLLGWLEKCCEKNVVLTEKEVDQKFQLLCKNLPGHHCFSFPSIIASGKNAASPHHVTNGDVINYSEIILLDVGSHFVFGTTDTTRTVLLDMKNYKYLEKIIHDYTLVLKCHIRPMMKKYKKGSFYSEVDKNGREALLQEGKNFNHGLSHGVGHFLCVHETPPAVTSSSHVSEILADQIISVEPGFYIENEYGIRIESLARTIKTGEEIELVNMTPLPFQKTLIDKNMLSEEEIMFIDKHNELSKKVMSDLLDDNGQEYLLKNTFCE